MTYICWAACYEGASDHAYFDVLLPRLMEDVVLARGTRTVTVPVSPAVKFSRGPVRQVAQAACKESAAFHIIFFQADTGGCGLSTTLDSRLTGYCQAMSELCDWPLQRCVPISPRHETEAWLLADANAVIDALGYAGLPRSLGLPENAREAERLTDPKEALASAARQVRGPRRRADSVLSLFPAIAQRQSLQALRQADSFRDFENRLLGALQNLGCI